MYFHNKTTWLLFMATLLSACQNTIDSSRATWRCAEAIPARAPETMTARVPQVMGTRAVKIFGGDGVVAVNPRTEYVYIGGSSHVTILKGTEIINVVETKGIAVVSMAVDEINGWVYAVNEYTDNVTVMRGTEVVGVVPTIGKSPWGVAVEPKSGFAYIVSMYKSRPLREVEGNILVISGPRIIDNIKFSDFFPTQVLADPITGLVYALGIGKIVIIKGLEEIARYNFQVGQMATDVNKRTGEVFLITNEILYRFREGKLLDSVSLPKNLGVRERILVHPITNAVYIPHSGYTRAQSRILVVKDMKILDDLFVSSPSALYALAVDPLTENVYAADFGDEINANSVSVINGTQILKTFEVGEHPYNIGVNPVNGWVYVSNINDGTVTILGYPDQKTIPYPGPYPK